MFNGEIMGILDTVGRITCASAAVACFRGEGIPGSLARKKEGDVAAAQDVTDSGVRRA